MTTADHDKPAIVLFRQDLRLADNRALHAAVESGKPILPIFVLDDAGAARPRGAAKLWWLHHSLSSLAKDMENAGATLVLRKGKTRDIVGAAIDKTGADLVLWNRRYDPGRADDDALAGWLSGEGVDHADFDGFLMHEPEDVQTKSRTPFKVFTPFWRALSSQIDPRDPLPRPAKLKGLADPSLFAGDRLEDWKLLPTNPDWSGGMRDTWKPGEEHAHEALADFLDGPIEHYEKERNNPAVEGTSRLSPRLAHGELTPFQVIHEIRARKLRFGDRDVESFRREIGWREFCNQLLYNHPDLHTANFDKTFDAFPWRKSDAHLKAWQRGMTGYPIVDAGMRQLWQTGWMHNRVRLITASFLVKDLLIDWRDGEAWFWDALVDADHGDNSANWQWVAGSGADAAPYFRIFNPVLQGEKFDPDGDYVRHYVPELAKLPNKLIHKPWTAKPDQLAAGRITLGETYPEPIVDHNKARDSALQAYREMRA